MDASEIIRKLKVARKNPGRIVDGLREPRPLVRGTRVANVLGLQVARTCVDRAAWHLRPSRVTARVADAYATLQRDGIVVIPNFLAAEEFEALDAERRASNQDPQVRRYQTIEFGENFVARSLHVSEYPQDYPVFMRALRDHPFLLELASAVSRRRMTYRPHVSILQITKPTPDAPHEETDPNQYIHADRHYSFVKAFFYMDDVTADGAPYTYAPGSHVINAARLRYEYEASILYARLYREWSKSRDRARIAGDSRGQSQTVISVEAQRLKLAEKLLADLGTELRPVVAAKNTMIISNNIGLHRRNPLRTAGPRTTINIDYKYLESPAQWMYPVLRHLYRVPRAEAT